MEEKKAADKIAILTCLNSNDVCTRAGCLNAFFEKKAFFEGYGEDAQLTALMTCNGCAGTRPMEPRDDPGMQEKLERLVQEGVDAVHVGVCRMKQNGQECERITQICELLEERRIRVVRGTHREYHT